MAQLLAREGQLVALDPARGIHDETTRGLEDALRGDVLRPGGTDEPPEHLSRLASAQILQTFAGAAAEPGDSLAAAARRGLAHAHLGEGKIGIGIRIGISTNLLPPS